jgi:hypothetical protein
VSSDENLIDIKELSKKLGGKSLPWIREKVNGGVIPAIKWNSRTWSFHWPTVLAAISKL